MSWTLTSCKCTGLWYVGGYCHSNHVRIELLFLSLVPVPRVTNLLKDWGK